MPLLTPLTPVDGDTILPLEEARLHLNLTPADSYHDDTVTALRNSAIEWVEAYTGIALLTRRFRWTTGGFSPTIYLPRGPVVSIETIVYRATDGVDATLPDTGWYLAGDVVTSGYGVPWPYGDHVRLDFTAGFASTNEIPTMLMAAVKVALAAMFNDREDPDFAGAMRCADLARGVIVA